MDSRLFCFFISGEENQVFPGSGLWQFPLSGKTPDFLTDSLSDHKTCDSIITIGDYFLASSMFLSENAFSILKSGLKIVYDISVQTDQICKVTLFLEKHGAFYHPLKIQVALTEHRICLFVLNGAVSKQGLLLIEKEYQLISGLNKIYLKRYLPQVFGVDVIKTDKGRIGFFLGEWFDGFKEFHVTKDQDIKQISIWESDGKRNYIPETSALPIYQEISRILTYYYDIESFEQIFPWHHAAGDFIVRQEDGKVHVRLITIRGYSSVTPFGTNEADKKKHILPSLLFFFLNMTLRMRLDRINGTGRMVMLGEQMVSSTIDGFLSALDEKSLDYDYGDLRLIFIEFFRQFNLEQIMGLLENILEDCHLDPSEIEVTTGNFESHCKLLHSIFKNV
ncbi:MAG: hypothetical protein H8D87_04530 [Deltaproteobacteria bacterium]|uniref:hypothetical protein n=1 Tax=Desulfobacula sp. TaxID=2593537 RepID=UPI00198806EF|nr:hypothetical protein [Candidatus Desulfobacula maris]MBL6996631.1 hypothetical protein [Desulfobacula sp.]